MSRSLPRMGQTTPWSGPSAARGIVAGQQDTAFVGLSGEKRRSTLRDLAFFVREVLPAHGAKLLQLELLGHRALVLGRRVVGAATVAAGHLDDVTHGESVRLA